MKGVRALHFRVSRVFLDRLRRETASSLIIFLSILCSHAESANYIEKQILKDILAAVNSIYKHPSFF